MANRFRHPRGSDFFAVCGLLAVAAPATGAAQLATTIHLEDRQVAVARVPTGSVIRLRLADGSRAGGPIQRWGVYSLTLAPYLGYAERDTTLPLVAIDTLWVRGSASRRGAVIGGIAGGAFGLTLGLTQRSLCTTGNRTDPCAQGAFSGTAGGLLVGGFVGALVGSGSPAWRRLHPRSRARPAEPLGTLVTLQAPGDSGAPDPRMIALMRAGRDHLLRLTIRDRPDLAGYLVRGGAQQAMLAATIGAPASATGSSLPITSVDAIWERTSARRSGAVVGLLIGATAGTLLTTASDACDPDGCTLGIVGNGAVGAIAGWLVGEKVGSVFPRWQRRY